MTEMLTPTISVLMSVHNGGRHLKEAIQSVLTQTFADFEFIIVEDYSSDCTLDILEKAAALDPRIRVIKNQSNLGLTRSLNVGLEAAKGELVARIDADDICLPRRFSTQHRFLSQHSDFSAVATGHYKIDEHGRTVSTSDEGLDDWQIRWLGGFNPPAPHPTYMFRRLRSDGTPNFYDETFRTAQDFDLWSRLALQGKTAVLPEPLVKYRRHAGAITVRHRREQAENCKRTGIANLQRRLPRETVAKLKVLADMFSYDIRADSETIAAAVAGCDAMVAHDLPLAPSEYHKVWMQRMCAGLLAEAILSRGSGLRSPCATIAFLIKARRYIPHLMRVIAADPAKAAKSLNSAGRI